MTKAKILLLPGIILYSVFPVAAQQTIIEKYNLPVYNCHIKYLENFAGQNPVVVIPDDTTGLAEYIDFFSKMLVGDAPENVKFEKSLSKSDYRRPMLILGPLDKFRKWDRFDLPVVKTPDGFSVPGYDFSEPDYGFTYVTDSLSSPIKIVASGNSDEAFKQSLIMFSPGFNFVANRGRIAEVFGNFPDTVVDMDFVKKDHYDVIETDFYRFHVSRNTDSKMRSSLEKEFPEFDGHVRAFTKKMELEVPEERINSYIHADQIEISYACGFFDGACGGTIWGFENGGEIHSYKGFGAVKHESNHYLFAQVNKDAPTFLVEGIQTWYENYEDPRRRDEGLKKALEFIDEDISGVILTGMGFHRGDKYYKISGIFVDYLLDSYGLGKFKELYRYDYATAETAYEKTYGLSVFDILENYRDWLVQQDKPSINSNE